MTRIDWAGTCLLFQLFDHLFLDFYDNQLCHISSTPNVPSMLAQAAANGRVNSISAKPTSPGPFS